jgi:hypothetical protein
MIWLIFAIFAIFAVCWTIAVNSPHYVRSKRERAQADREYEASKRFQARLAARTPEQVAADKELDEAQCYVSEFRKGDYNPEQLEDMKFGYDRAAHADESRARLARAIEGRKAAYSPTPGDPKPDSTSGR